MQVAQKLYEKGMITYMRTDSTVLSEQAIKAARKEILDLYGKHFLPSEPRDYGKKKVKGAALVFKPAHTVRHRVVQPPAPQEQQQPPHHCE